MRTTFCRLAMGLALMGHGFLSAAATIRVFAAASLTESLRAIATEYERQTPDQVVYNFGASSFLARQIEEGAPADLFFSADEARMDALENKGILVKASRKRRLSNALVIVAATDSALPIRSARDLADPRVKHLALADPRTVPAGIYAKAFLEKAGLWDAVTKKVVPMDNVRAALAAVESGNADAGMVYKTDARISRSVKIAYEVPSGDGPDISYPMAILKETKVPEAAARFFKYLDSDAAGRIFERYGFIVRP